MLYVIRHLFYHFNCCDSMGYKGKSLGQHIIFVTFLFFEIGFSKAANFLSIISSEFFMDFPKQLIYNKMSFKFKAQLIKIIIVFRNFNFKVPLNVIVFRNYGKCLALQPWIYG